MINIYESLKLLKEKPDYSTEDGLKQVRERGIVLTALTAMLAKVFAIVIPLITLRITLSYMGDEIYGLWSAVSSFFVLFSFADLGLGSGLQTELSKASALNDNTICCRLVSSCYVILTVVSAGLILVFFAFYPFVDWIVLLNAKSEQSALLAGGVVMAIVISKILNIPLALIQRTQFAMQEGYRSNIWMCCGNLLSLIFVIVIYYLNLGVLALIWASSMINVIVAALNLFVYFKWHRPELRPRLRNFDKQISKQLLSTGIQFFVLSILTSLSLSVDSYIVAKVQTLSDVTPFSVMYKIAVMIGAVSAMFSAPMWSANGEALQHGEFGWVKKMTKKIMLFSLLFSTLCSIGLLVFIKPALRILTEGKVQADYVLLLGMCLMQILVSVTNPYFMILNGAGIVKFQIVNYIFYAAVSLPLKYFLGLHYGTIMIVWVGTISYALVLTVPTYWKSTKLIREKVKNK